MKKLERMDGKLFESLKVNEMKNLGAFMGGEVIATSGTQDFQVGKTIYTKRFTDKQKGMYVKDVWVDDGCPYGHVYFDRALNDLQNVEFVVDDVNSVIID